MPKRPARFRWRPAGLALACSLLMFEGATAGPPFLTDDPEPVELGHYEFYTFSTGSGVKDDTSGVLPGFEFNYGLIPNGQLHVIARTAFDHPAGGPTNFGLGDTELGFKYRFIQEQTDGARPQVGVFPLVELPTGDQGRGLGAGHASLYLPLWIQKSFGKWTTYGGSGYWFNQDKKLGDRNYWFAGWLLQRQVTKSLALGGELFHQTAYKIGGRDSTGFNLGGVYDVNEHNHLLFSAGRAFQNASATNQFSWYLAWQITY